MTPWKYGFLFLLFSLLAGHSAGAEPIGDTKIVRADIASVFREPSEISELVTQVLAGDKVRVKKTVGEWAQVVVLEQYRTAEGYPGWIRAGALASAEVREQSLILSVAFPRVHLRSEPNKSAPSVATVYLATRLATTGASRVSQGEEWLEVQIPQAQLPSWVRKSQVSKEVPLISGQGDKVVAKARLLKGTPYLWGGMSQNGIDCSGFVYTLYRTHGITVPRDADQQFLVGSKIGRDELEEGDMIFFGKSPEDITHVGIYSGKGNLIHASSGRGVVEDPLFSGWYLQHYQGARRILTQDSSKPRVLLPKVSP